MSQQWSVPAWAVVALVAAALVLLVALVVLGLRSRSARRALARSRQDVAALDERLSALEERLSAPVPQPQQRAAVPREPTSPRPMICTGSDSSRKWLSCKNEQSGEVVPLLQSLFEADIVPS